METADVFVGSFSGVVPMAPSPLAISVLLGLDGGPLSPSVSFFHQSSWKTTFICRNSHKLLIGRDEFMIESCCIIIVEDRACPRGCSYALDGQTLCLVSKQF